LSSWVDTEFSEQNMGDKRLNTRAKKLVANLSRDASLSIPNANKTWAETHAAYRFFDNDKVSFVSIMSGHWAETLKRIKNESVILVPQDTTFLNFATDDKSKEMGTLRVKKSNQQLLHTSIAITPGRVNLGVVDGTLWQREDKAVETSHRAEEEKESQRWLSHYKSACHLQEKSPETTVVSIADREGDIHDWYQLAEDTPIDSRASYIVRAKINRALYVNDDERTSLWDYMNGLNHLGKYIITLPQKSGRPGREANVKVYVSEIELAGRGKKRRPLFLNAVYVKEVKPPKGEKGIEWMLLTDLPLDDMKNAKMIIDWYQCRWEIEIYFRVLKGSCDIEKNRFRNKKRMFNCIAVYMIISWRLHGMTMQARHSPDLPCNEAFSDTEWEILFRVSNKGLPLPKEPPSTKTMVRMLAQLGGFLGRKGDGEPGVKTIWQGYNKLLHYIDAAEAFGV
jgi:hypothetical protein